MAAPLALPLIDRDRCDGCGRCAELCPSGAVGLRGGKAALARPDACTFCEVCEACCPRGAIGRPFLIIFRRPARP